MMFELGCLGLGKDSGQVGSIQGPDRSALNQFSSDALYDRVNIFNAEINLLDKAHGSEIGCLLKGHFETGKIGLQHIAKFNIIVEGQYAQVRGYTKIQLSCRIVDACCTPVVGGNSGCRTAMIWQRFPLLKDIIVIAETGLGN